MAYLKHSFLLLVLSLAATYGGAQPVSQAVAPLPSPSFLAEIVTPACAGDFLSSSGTTAEAFSFDPAASAQSTANTKNGQPPKPQPPKPQSKGPVDANGKPIPLDRYQPHRILGFMPNFRTVSAGAATHRPGWKYNFEVASHQALDYSSFIFLGLTSLTSEGINEHPALGKGAGGFYAYTWRGFLDKTDNTYLSAGLLASLLHEDTRYYPLGSGHPIFVRALYVISREAVARTYNGRNTPNIAGLGGKVLTQYISTYYYPTSSEGFGVLVEKFGYSVMRDVAFSSLREFYPDIAAHYIRKHREKAARQAARDAKASGATP